MGVFGLLGLLGFSPNIPNQVGPYATDYHYTLTLSLTLTLTLILTRWARMTRTTIVSAPTRSRGRLGVELRGRG